MRHVETGGQPGRSQMRYGVSEFESGCGAATLESILAAARRLAFVNTLGLPFDAMTNVDLALVQRLSRRVDGDRGRAAATATRAGWGSSRFISMHRRAQMIRRADRPSLFEIIHRMQTRSRRRVGAIARDIERSMAKGTPVCRYGHRRRGRPWRVGCLRSFILSRAWPG